MTFPELFAKAARNIISQDPDPSREGLRETPDRVSAAWEHWLSGYAVDVDALCKVFDDGGEGYDEMVFVGTIPFYSHCEHHLAPFFGEAHVAYIPFNRKIIGLSKIPRVVDAFARRLTVQERITTQVADTLERNLKPRGVGVIIEARHLCVESRGVGKPGTITRTCALRGVMRESAGARAEFLSMANMRTGAR
jgi:GTP cyclohydrolase I